MIKRFYSVFISLVFIGITSSTLAQTLPPNQPEQDACSALEICGNFYTPYSYDGIGQVADLTATPCGGGEANSVWFRLEITNPGILVFKIVPNDSLDDYDFAVVDITNGNCNSIQQNDVVRCNFNNNEQPNNYYYGGIVGLNTTSNLLYVAGGTFGEPFLQQINASAGDVYLIMVNNFGHDDCLGSCPGSGFTLDFTGSTATFNQLPPPVMDSLDHQCDYSDSLIVNLSQNVLCSSIAPDGSDFYLTPFGSVASAEGLGCSGNQGYTHRVKIKFTNPLTYADYVLHAQVGTDTNTLLGLCNVALELPDTLHFVGGQPAILMDSLGSPACQNLTIFLNHEVKCATIASDGSDFEVHGPSNVLVDGAQGINCNAQDMTRVVSVHLAQPIAVDGRYYLLTKIGNDANTLEDTCGAIAPVGDSILFRINSFNGHLTAHPNTSMCPGIVQLFTTTTATPPQGGFDFTWYSDTDTAFHTTHQATPNVSIDSGYHHFLVETVDSEGCYLRDSVVVRGFSAPIADFSFNKSVECNGDTVYFHNESQLANHYLWRFGDQNLTDTALNTQHFYSQPGTYLVTLIAQNAYCRDSIIKMVVIGQQMHAGFSKSADTICVGTSVQFTNNSFVPTVNNIPPEYKWYFGNGDHSSLKNPSYTYTNPGIYQITLLARSGTPCYDTVIQTIVVDSMPDLSFQMSDTPICKGEKVIFTGFYSEGGLRHIYWNFGDEPDNRKDANPTSHAYDQPGKYTVTLSADYRRCPDTSLTAEIRVKDIPYLNIGSDTTICLDAGPLILQDKQNTHNPEIHWLWSTGETTPKITVTHPGHYWARVSLDGCSTRDDIIIRKDCYIDIPNSFTPNGDGVNDYFIPRQLLAKGLNSFKMSIFNRWGEKIFESITVDGRGWDGRFNGKPQPQGVYIYMIQVVYKNGRHDKYTGNVTLIR